MAADQRGQDGDLAAGVAAVYIVAGILRLGVAQLLSDLQSLVKAQILPHHLGEHEVGGAVDDAFHLGDDVGREALVHRGDDGRTAAHGRLEQEGAVVCLGQSQQLCAVGGHHLLVGGADAPAALEAGLDIRVSEAGAADGLDDDLYFGVFQNGVKILYKQLCGRMIREVFGVKDVLDLYRFACTAGDACGVAAEHLVHAAAHRAKAQNRDFCHDTALVPFSMNVLSQIVSAVYAHDHPLARKLFRQLLGGHLHGVGADGDSHQRGSVLRSRLIDGHDAGAGGTDAGQKAL